MCGRFLQITPPAELAHAYSVGGFLSPACGVRPRYNLAPTQPVWAVRLNRAGERELVRVTWGLLPAWAKEAKPGYATINARAETVAEKPTFRAAFRRRRCLIPADGFYEWQALPGGHGKQPWLIRAADGGTLWLGGLWERWEGGDRVIESCTVVVTEANELVRPIHERMPVILPPGSQAAWLDPSARPADLKALLVPCPAETLRAHPVGTRVNDPTNDDETLLEEAREEG